MSSLKLQRVDYDGPLNRQFNISLVLPEVYVGRSPQSTVCIPDPTISRQHVKLTGREDGAWTVTDLSTNGVFLNGARLPRNESTPLRVNDTLRLDPVAKYVYTVTEEETDGPPPAKRALASADHERRLAEEAAEQLRKEREAKQEEERKLREEKEQIEARLQQMQEELIGQQQQAEKERELAKRAAEEREELASKMAVLKEELDRKEQEMEEEKRVREERLREQLAAQEQALKNQLAAEVSRLQQERDQIETQLKGELATTCRSGEELQARCADIERELTSLDAKRQLLEKQLADTEREKEAACGQQLSARQAVLDSFSNVMDAELTCSICSELFFSAVTLNCTHTYCQSCIGEWLKGHTTCPICREPVVAQTRSLVLDNFIERMVGQLGGELGEHRATVRRERLAAEAAATAARGGRGGARGRGGRRQNYQYRPRQQLPQPRQQLQQPRPQFPPPRPQGQQPRPQGQQQRPQGQPPRQPGQQPQRIIMRVPNRAYVLQMQ